MATRQRNRAARAQQEEGETADAAEEVVEAEAEAEGEEHRRRGRRAMRREADEPRDELGGLIAAAAIGGGAIALESELLPGILIGAAAVILGRMFPTVAGVVGGVVRPVLKTAIRTGYAITESTRGAMAEAQEQFHDMVAEVEAERGGRTGRRRAA